jgi:hypothetical protein
MDKLVHFELPADNLTRAKKFYEEIFDWKITEWDMPDGSKYLGVNTVETDEKTHLPKEPGAINGGIIERSQMTKAPIFAMHVSSIDDYIPKIEAAGGSVVKAKTDIMGMGFYAYATDSEGNVIGLWEDAKK